MKVERRERNPRRRGSATVLAMVLVVLLMIFSGGMLATALRGKNERVSAVEVHRADFTADAGVSHALTNLTAEDESDIGSEEAPIAFGGGSYWATVADNGDDTFLVTSTGTNGRAASRVEAVISPIGRSIYDHAVFAGNSDDDPLYTLEFGGVGGTADEIDGDVYSGADVEVSDDATISGEIRAGGSITGASGSTGVTQPTPDLAGMNYESTADFDVAQLFDEDGYWARGTSGGPGGSAYQVPEESPAHVFRKNPSDRTTNTSSTEKDDYFLEDPYEPLRVDPDQNGSDPYEFSFSGISGEPGPDSNQKVFYIDGNLWLHNKKSYSLGLSHNEPGGVQVTFVVKGNIYFSDNLFYEDATTDGMAFIAMKDGSVEDSGNIFFGDPVYGTLQEMHAFMYAENNFYDLNLDAEGSSEVELYGNMTAGNQVVIERGSGTRHTKLHVDFDDRISTGQLEMPGLPGTKGGEVRYVVTYWHRIATQDTEVAAP